MFLPALATLYTDEESLDSLLSTVGANLRLDDDNTGTVSPTEEAYLTGQGINAATGKINAYCLGRYDAAKLATSWTVWEWCTIIAARWLCSRRGNRVPESIADMYDECIKLLERIQGNSFSLSDLAARNVNTIGFSNVTVQPGYWYRKARVQRSLGDGVPAQHPQALDWVSSNVYEI